MSDTVYDGYRNAGDHANAVTDWYVNLIATYGPFPVLAVELAIVISLVAGAWALIERSEQRTHRNDGIEQLEHFANHPANRTRKEDRP